MKKRLKKLALSRETLRNLQSRELGQAAGRGHGCTLEDWTTCQCTEGGCDSGGGTYTCTCPSGHPCPTATFEDWTCCDC